MTKTLKFKTDCRFTKNYSEAVGWCKDHLGDKDETEFNVITKKHRNNHGKWACSMGTFYFRYEKDLVWFLLSCSNLADKEKANESHARMARVRMVDWLLSHEKPN